MNDSHCRVMSFDNNQKVILLKLELIFTVEQLSNIRIKFKYLYKINYLFIFYLIYRFLSFICCPCHN